MNRKTEEVAAKVVETLKEYGGLYNRQIANMTGIPEQATHRAIQHLLKQGKVKKHRRGVMVDYYLTPPPTKS